MKNVFKALTVLLTLFSLTGCGLKGPLYFPPADKNAPPPTNATTNRTAKKERTPFLAPDFLLRLPRPLEISRLFCDACPEGCLRIGWFWSPEELL